MYPHERSLVKNFEGKPFVILAVNSDPKDRLKKLYKDKTISWRAWWDDGDTSGPIATSWNVHGWPTIYVLDGKGVIRAKNMRDKQLEKELEQLLAEMEHK